MTRALRHNVADLAAGRDTEMVRYRGGSRGLPGPGGGARAGPHSRSRHGGGRSDISAYLASPMFDSLHAKTRHRARHRPGLGLVTSPRQSHPVSIISQCKVL